MAEGKGNLLYAKEEEEEIDHEDIWDDTALIAAYDKAVGLMKVKHNLSGSDTSSRKTKGDSKRPQSKKTSKLRRRSGSNKSKTKKWKEGNTCMAIYSEDGLWYPAVISSINHDMGTCVVEYTGYGNTEEVSLNDISTPRRFKSRSYSDSNVNAHTSETSEAELTFNCNMENDDFNDQRSQCSRNCMHNESSSFHHPQWPPTFNNTPWTFSAPPPWHGTTAHSCCAQSPCGSRKMNLPPPPTPLLPPLLFESVDDALASTLMAWYMSGYHTGYYQAMKQHSKGSCHH